MVVLALKSKKHKSDSSLRSEKKRGHAKAKTKRAGTRKGSAGEISKPIPASPSKSKPKAQKQPTLLDSVGFYKRVELKSGAVINVTSQSILAQPGKKQHECVQCRRSFASGAALKSHITHTHPVSEPVQTNTIKLKNNPVAPGLGLEPQHDRASLL